MINKNINNKNNGFTLAESLAALMITTMLLAAVIGIYTGVRRTAVSIEDKTKSGVITKGVLQKIAEDIDSKLTGDEDTTLQVHNKIEAGGYKSAQIIIENKFYDKNNKQQSFEKIIYQSKYSADANGLVLYRSRSGYSLEDKMLDADKETYETEQYIPLASGITMFQVQVINGEQMLSEWQESKLPPGLEISISFAPFTTDITGQAVIDETEIFKRTIAVNRFRTIGYKFLQIDLPDINDIIDYNDTEDGNDMEEDVNDIDAAQEPNDTDEINEYRE